MSVIHLRESMQMAIDILRTDAPNKVEIAIRMLEVSLATRQVTGVVGIYTEDLPDRIRAARANLGMSQAQFAVHIGVSPALVGQWERGEGNPTMKNARKLAEVLS